MLFHTLRQQIWDTSMLSVSGFALWRGGLPERVVALANIAASLTSALVENRSDLVDPQWGILVVDVLFLALLLWFAFRSDRHWPLWASAFQLLNVATHIAIMADRTVGLRAYMTAVDIWSYLILASLGIGTWAHWRRTARLAQQIPGAD